MPPPPKKQTFRVYFIAHRDGRRTGVLMRAKNFVFDRPAPTAIGTDEDDVLRQLEAMLAAMEATGEDDATRYLWDEDFETREVLVEVHPQSAVKKRAVVGARQIPLRLTYAYSEIPAGGYRLMLPRFGWNIVVENLAIAPEVLRSAISAALLGENPRGIYDFRREGSEYVVSWSPRSAHRADQTRAEAPHRGPERPTLRRVAEDWVERAAKGRLAPVVGEIDGFARVPPLVARTPLPSLLFVGGAGVGKSTYVRALARYLLLRRRDAPEADTPGLWATSSDRLIGGMIYLGMWQERCLNLVKELSFERDYLYVDKLLHLMRPQPGGGSIAEVFAPPVIAGEMTLVAEATEPEYEAALRAMPGLVGAFHVLRVEEPPQHRLATQIELYQARKNAALALHPAAVRRLLRHLVAFQRDLCFPGKAFRFIDWLNASAAPPMSSTTATATATATMSAATGATAPTAAEPGTTAAQRVLYPADISAAYARQTGLPIELIADEKQASDAHLAGVLRRGVVGQDHACDAAARVLSRFKAGLNDPDKPCGTLLFVGPTGVGKTELAKQLARFMFGDANRMIRLDMSEYMLPGAAQRLLEVGNGVTSLAQRVREQPLSLVLFDEIEKAHPQVFDLLLGVLGEGRMTDSLGGHVDFRMSVVVMTSNLGAGAAPAVGFGAEARDDADGLTAVRRHFRPEFFNRIDYVVPFRALSREDVLAIVDLSLAEAGARTGLVRRGIRLAVSPDARRALAARGFDPARGARPLKRVIEEQVVARVAARLASDAALRDQTLRVDVGPAGELTLDGAAD